MIYQIIARQITQLITGLVNAHAVVNFTHVTHIFFFMSNALIVINRDISSRSVILLSTFLLVLSNLVVSVL